MPGLAKGVEVYTALRAWEALGRAMLENDPADMAADGVTLLDVWRKEVRRLLQR